jgi:hypothetical protein
MLISFIFYRSSVWNARCTFFLDRWSTLLLFIQLECTTGLKQQTGTELTPESCDSNTWHHNWTLQPSCMHVLLNGMAS